MSKLGLAIDFDGVLHSYKSGWLGAAVIPDPPVPGAMRWLAEIVTSNKFNVMVFSSRNHQYMGIESMTRWIERELLLELNDRHLCAWIINNIEFPINKPAAFLTIDDRAMQFTGNFDDFKPDTLKSFKTWVEDETVC